MNKILKDDFQCLETGEYVRSDYKLKGHVQAKQKDCPGQTLFETMKNWPRWVNLVVISISYQVT